MKIKIIGLMLCLSAIVLEYAFPQSVGMIPDAGNAVVLLSNPGMVVKEVDGNQQKKWWTFWEQYQIKAGSRTLAGTYPSDAWVSGNILYNTINDFSMRIEFEEGKSYSLVVNHPPFKDSTGVIYNIEHLKYQNEIKVKKYMYTYFNYPRICYSPDGSMIVISNNKLLEIFNVQDNSLLKTFKGHRAHVNAVKWTADGDKIVSGDNRGVIKVWDVSTGIEILSIAGKKAINSLNITPDGSKAVVNNNSVLRIWDIVNGRELFSAPNLRNVILSPDGQNIAASFNDNTRLYSINGGEPKKVYDVNLFPRAFKDNNTLYGSDDEKFFTFDLNTQRITTIMSRPIIAVALNSRGDKIIALERCITPSSYNLGVLHIIDANTGNVIKRITNPYGKLSVFDVSPTENKVVGFTVLESAARFWDF